MHVLMMLILAGLPVDMVGSPVNMAGPSINMAGVWKLPVRNPVSQLSIVHSKVSKEYDTFAVLRVNSLYGKPVSLPMYGNVTKSGKNIDLILESKAIPISKACNLSVMIVATGKLKGKKYKAKSLFGTILECKSVGSRVALENMNGTWIRTEKTNKPSKHTKI